MSYSSSNTPKQPENTLPIDAALKAEAVQIVSRFSQEGRQNFLRSEINRLRMWGANQLVQIVGPKRFIDALVAMQTVEPRQRTMHRLMQCIEPDAKARAALYNEMEKRVGTEVRYQPDASTHSVEEGGNIPMATASALKGLRAVDASAVSTSAIGSLVGKLQAVVANDPAAEWLSAIPEIDASTASTLIQEMEQSGNDFHAWNKAEEDRHFRNNEAMMREAAGCVVKLQSELQAIEIDSRTRHGAELARIDADIAQLNALSAGSNAGKEVMVAAVQQLQSRRTTVAQEADLNVRKDTQGCRNIIDRLAVIAYGHPILYKQGDPQTTEDINI